MLEIENYLENISHNLFCCPPDKTALIFDEQEISYQTMAENVANTITLFEELKISSNKVVAIYLHKSPEFIYTTVACALLGIIWLPIDMDSPITRRNYLLSNSKVDIIISDLNVDGIDNIENININNYLKKAKQSKSATFYITNPKKITLDKSHAYYLYTSGSTGTPKCVVLNRLATANVLEQTIRKWQLTHNDIFFAITPFHHDMSIFDIFAPLSLGATLVIPNAMQYKDALAWVELVNKNKVSIWVSVPAIVDMLFSVATKNQINSLRLIAQGGDYINLSLINQIRNLLPNTRLFSLGGPTETTIWSIWHEITKEDDKQIPYGKALEHNTYYILDDNKNCCPVNEIGTMYMTGINLSNGYLVDGIVQYQDFINIDDNNGNKQMAFKMSDKGLYRNDGNIIFCGRDTGYLKIKGTRISAVEVESFLVEHPSIYNGVVVTYHNTEFETDELVAVIILKTSIKNLEKSEIKKFLRQYLPSSHIPTRYLFLPNFPLSSNGKVDRKALQQIIEKKYATPNIENK